MAKLAQYLEQTLGSYLRAVATYRDDDWELLYARDDLHERIDELDLENLICQFREAELDQTIDNDVFDGHSVTLRSYSDMLILHLVSDDTSHGTLISFDTNAGSDFLSFASECANLATTLPHELAQRESDLVSGELNKGS